MIQNIKNQECKNSHLKTYYQRITVFVAVLKKGGGGEKAALSQVLFFFFLKLVFNNNNDMWGCS